MSFHCDRTLTMKTEKQHFCIAFQLIMMSAHTQFDNKRFSSSEDIVWTNIH